MKNKIFKIYSELLKVKSGMTLIELIVAMTIVVIMLAGTVVFLPNYRDNQALKQGSLDLNDSLRYAQTKSLSQNDTEYTVWKVLNGDDPKICVIGGVDYKTDSECATSGKIFELSDKLSIVTNVPIIFWQGKTGTMFNSPDFETASLISGEARLIHINHSEQGDMYYGVTMAANSFSLEQNSISEDTYDTTTVLVCSDPNATNYGANESCVFESQVVGDDDVPPGTGTVTGCTANGCPTGQECIENTCQVVTDDEIIPYRCQSDTECGTEYYCLDGDCLPKNQVGGTCETANQCQAGLECAISTDQIKRCLLPLNSTCYDSSNCVSGFCFAGKCINYVPLGGRCEIVNNKSNCIAGSSCICIQGPFSKTCTCKQY